MANRQEAWVKVLVLILFSALFFGSVGCEKKAPPPRPTAESFYYHTISFSGETLSNIAGWYTGSFQNWMIIRDANPGVDAHRLRIGSVVKIPRSILIKETPMTKAFIDSSRKVKEVQPSQTPAPETTPTESSPAVQVPPEQPAETQVQPEEEVAKEVPAVKEEIPEPPAQPEQPQQPSTGEQSSVAAPQSTDKVEDRTKTRDELLKELLEDY